uniref:Candidate secreted effector n=1 Tax=Meloidogyne incognita TaxID=6306 RepID=A0A914MLI4_MELIC
MKRSVKKGNFIKNQNQMLKCIKSSCRKIVHYCGLATLSWSSTKFDEQEGMHQQEHQQQHNNERPYNVRRFPKKFKCGKRIYAWHAWSVPSKSASERSRHFMF